MVCASKIASAKAKAPEVKIKGIVHCHIQLSHAFIPSFLCQFRFCFFTSICLKVRLVNNFFRIFFQNKGAKRGAQCPFCGPCFSIEDKFTKSLKKPKHLLILSSQQRYNTFIIFIIHYGGKPMQFLKTHTGIVILCGVLVVALIGGLAYAFSDAPAAPVSETEPSASATDEIAPEMRRMKHRRKSTLRWPAPRRTPPILPASLWPTLPKGIWCVYTSAARASASMP